MRLHRLAGVAVVGVAAAASLGGCEVREQYGATCQTSPPVPHQNYGFVEIDVEIPPEVVPGETFTIRVDSMVGYSYEAGPGSHQSGTISVTGPVTPSGNFAVGQGLLGGTPYPNTLELTVTGQPGEQIRLGAIDGHTFVGSFPEEGFYVTCRTSGGEDGVEVAVIPIVEPD